MLLVIAGIIGLGTTPALHYKYEFLNVICDSM